MYGSYARTEKQGLSPRSKMISMGLSNFEPVPLRFRPLKKASDNPQTNAPQSPDYKAYDEYDFETKETSSEQNYQNTLPSPDELRSQYTDFQRKIIAEQLSGNYNHSTVSPERAQTLTKGLDYEGNLSSPRSMREKYNDYAKKLEADRGAAIELTRRKFVRNIDEDSRNMEGLVIGKQMDRETMQRTKRDQQAAYQQQLASDIRSKPIALERKAVERRAPSPQSQHISLMERIGDRGDGNGGGGMTDAEFRRQEAQRVLATNRADVMARLNEGSSPEGKQARQAAKFGHNDEAAKFEEAPYRFIGGSQEAGRDRKRAMQEQYLAQLLADNGPPSQGRAHRPDEEAALAAAQYSNRSGWTGLNIGGHSMDEANRSGASTEKQLKQAAYKRQLDQQKLQTEDLLRSNAMRYGRY